MLYSQWKVYKYHKIFETNWLNGKTLSHNFEPIYLLFKYTLPTNISCFGVVWSSANHSFLTKSKAQFRLTFEMELGLGTLCSLQETDVFYVQYWSNFSQLKKKCLE